MLVQNCNSMHTERISSWCCWFKDKASILFSLAETTIIIITVKGHEKDMWTASRHLDQLLSFLETSGIDCRFQLLGHGPESQQRFHRKSLKYQLYNILWETQQFFAMSFQCSSCFEREHLLCISRRLVCWYKYIYSS